MKRFVWLSGLVPLSLFSQECIYHALQKHIYKHERQHFIERFPKGHIIHRGHFYRFISGPYTHEEIIHALKKAKRYNPDAYVGRCRYIDTDATTENTTTQAVSAETVQPDSATSTQEQTTQVTQEESEQTAQNNEAQSISVQEYFKNPYAKNGNNSEDTGTQNGTSDEANASTTGHDEEVAQKAIDTLSSNSTVMTLTFQEFLHRFFQKDYNARNLDYDRKLQRVEALIEQDGYDWNFYVNAAVNYSRFIDYDLSVDKELSANIGLNVDKRLFDSGTLTKDLTLDLKNRLAQISYLSAKDKTALYALDIYAQAYLNQKLKDIYKKDYDNQKTMLALIQERHKAGLSSRVDEIDAKNDLLELKKIVIRQLYDYLYSDFLIRNTLDIHVKGPIKLEDFGFDVDKSDVMQLYKEAFYKNSALNAQRLQERIAKQRLKTRENSFLPIVDLTGAISYAYKKDFAYNPDKKTNGVEYAAGINVKVPLYSSENRSIYTQKAKLEYLKQHNLTLQQIKNLTRSIHKTFNEIKRLQNDLDIVDKQLELMKEKMFLVKQRYAEGLSPYRDYSDALKNYLAYMRQKSILEVQILQNEALLNTLEGHHIYYGEN